MIASYRDPRYAASIRIEELRARGHDLLEGVPEELTRIHARRVARISAGVVAIAGFCGMIVSAIAGVDRPQYSAFLYVHPTLFLVASVALSLAVYFLARSVASRTFARRVWSSFDDGQDELSRLARLENDSVRWAAARIVHASEKQSLALPMAGISLLAPLSLHLVVWCVLGDGDIGSRRWLSGFDWWICASLLLVGIAHVVLAGLCVRFAGKVADASLASLSRKSPMSGWAVLGWTVLAACVPGVIAFAIPVAIVFVTGVFIPLMFAFMHRRAIEERRALDVE